LVFPSSTLLPNMGAVPKKIGDVFGSAGPTLGPFFFLRVFYSLFSLQSTPTTGFRSFFVLGCPLSGVYLSLPNQTPHRPSLTGKCVFRVFPLCLKCPLLDCWSRGDMNGPRPHLFSFFSLVIAARSLRHSGRHTSRTPFL